MIGPILQRAISPKLSPSPSLSLLAADKPIPTAMINGTVMGPVVTPPASKATAVNSDGEKNDKINNRTYRIISSPERPT